MKRILAIVFALGLFVETPGWTQEVTGIPAAFLDIGVGARPLGMGGAYTAMLGQSHALFWNPAGPAKLSKKFADFSYVNQLGLVPYSAFSGGFSLAGMHSLALGVIASGDQQLRETTILFNYAVDLESLLPVWLSELFVGVQLKYHLASYGKNGLDASQYPLFSEQDLTAAQAAFASGSASGWGIDLGMIYRAGNRVFLGLAARDLISRIQWDSGDGAYNEGLPARLVLGLAYFARQSLLVTMDYDHYLNTDAPVRIRFGAEKVILNAFALRGGMGQTLAAESQRDYAIGTGFGFVMENVGRLNVDYAYHIHPLANMHRFSIGVQF